MANQTRHYFMNVHKRNQELKCVQLLQEKCKELEGYELKFGSDPPDILAIKHGSKSIAVEVSRIYSDDEGKGKGSIEQPGQTHLNSRPLI
jgi:hypothetical protein